MKQLFLIAALVAVAPVALATDIPKRSPLDARIQHVNYDENDVVRIEAAVGTATHIVLGEGESVHEKAAGFSAGWEIEDRRNNLYLKPKSVEARGQGQSGPSIMPPDPKKWDTNLIVTTDRRKYSFELVLLPEDSKRKPAFRVVFAYPKDDQAKALTVDDKRRVQEKLEQQPIPRNWRYTMQIGEQSSAIAPTMAYDDGRFTYLRFPGNRDFPTVFYASEDKGESLVNTHVDPKTPDVMVVHRVGKEFVLRLSNMVVSVYNEDFDALGVPPKSGTTQQGVRRVLKNSTGRFDLNDIEELPSVMGAPPELRGESRGIRGESTEVPGK
jgi:P-type conjugative transfer protein VirB9